MEGRNREKEREREKKKRKGEIVLGVFWMRSTILQLSLVDVVGVENL